MSPFVVNDIKWNRTRHRDEGQNIVIQFVVWIMFDLTHCNPKGYSSYSTGSTVPKQCGLQHSSWLSTHRYQSCNTWQHKVTLNTIAPVLQHIATQPSTHQHQCCNTCQPNHQHTVTSKSPMTATHTGTFVAGTLRHGLKKEEQKWERKLGLDPVIAKGLRR